MLFLRVLFCLILAAPAWGEDELMPLFHASLDFFDDLQRTEEGFYRDAFAHDPAENARLRKRCSTAACGVGLIALCMDHELGRDSTAENKALQSIHTLRRIERCPAGFFRHFFQSDTGKSRSEFSTIDTAILVAGVLACRNTFSNAELHREADQLWNSIQWESALATPDGRQLFMVMENGKAARPTQLFNEYLVLAELIRAFQQERFGDSAVVGITKLPTWNKSGLSLLSEPRRTPLSSFTVQFPFYLTHEGIQNTRYHEFCLAQALVDQAVMSKRTGAPHLWGCGAGGTPDRGYHADTFTDNTMDVVSPHIIAGFLPVYPEAKKHLLKIFRNPNRRITTRGGELLPRFSVKNPDWRASRIESIDYASMVFGLAAIHPKLGTKFFEKTTRVTFVTK